MTNREAFTPAPVGKFMFEEICQRWHHVRYGEAQFTEPRLPMVKLYGEETVRKLLSELDADKKQISEQRDYIDALENRLKQVIGHIAELESTND